MDQMGRSTTRPLVMTMLAAESSGTLVPLSRSDSDIELIDKTDEEDEGKQTYILSPESASIYESPLSSLYESPESPFSSPSYYATPMDQSPWTSPQASIKGHSPTTTTRLITITTSPFFVSSESNTGETSSTSSTSCFLSVPNVNGAKCRHKRSQSLKSNNNKTGDSKRLRRLDSAKAMVFQG